MPPRTSANLNGFINPRRERKTGETELEIIYLSILPGLKEHPMPLLGGSSRRWELLWWDPRAVGNAKSCLT